MSDIVDALSGSPAAGSIHRNAAVAIVPLGTSARFSLRLPDAAAVDIGTVAGFRLDMPINRCVVLGERMAIRLGPDEWLLLGPEAESDAIERGIAAAFGDAFFSLVDIGHRNLAVTVAGTHARAVINGGCPLDLDDAAFPAGSATRTLLGKAEIILIRPGGAPVYRLECSRSFGPYMHEFLKDIAREFE